MATSSIIVKGEDYLYSPYAKKDMTKLQIARTFFLLLSSFNNINLTNSELNLLEHMAVYGFTKNKYIDTYKVSKDATNNTICLLKKKNLLKGSGPGTHINPKVGIDFKNNSNFIFSFKCKEIKTNL